MIISRVNEGVWTGLMPVVLVVVVIIVDGTCAKILLHYLHVVP